ncbi:MAG TPA: GDP-fucose synthetase [Candidatus Taylorbacteria bacterium]|nr:MAG: NAD-dependent epimerase/dehydratase [Parcubacteria group bacterium GW2011_GWA2_47_64]KKU96678.1 MAG: NAD-dependent epimerase/dehydratase [Parcubacteria group bacterium GW2011_GWC2_48_17]HBV00769.1 GDP-fucose synthetase [Candidatus Taylorbacteria bacterium]
MNTDAKIYVAGHKGLVGSAIARALRAQGFSRILERSRKELDLLEQQKVHAFFKKEKPEYVFLAAAKVGGILANQTYPAEFIYENLTVQTNVIEAAYRNGVKKLLFLGSSCIYPRMAVQPMKEEYLLSGELEPTNRAYATAKIAGIVTCQAYAKEYGANFISAMPTNLYGQNDNFDLKNSHVLPALIRKFHEAKRGRKKEVALWGTGAPLREFLHVDDLADACVFLMRKYDDSEIINVGTGEDISIRALADLIKKITGFNGGVAWDASKPDGMPRKLLDVTKLHSLGWRHSISLTEGIKRTYEWYIKTHL